MGCRSLVCFKGVQAFVSLCWGMRVVSTRLGCQLLRYFEECTGASTSVLGDVSLPTWPLCEHGKVSGLNDDIVVPGDLTKRLVEKPVIYCCIT